MPVEAAMAVCRRTRVLKLVVLLLLTLGLLYQFFPDQMRDILEQFAPPNHEPESKESERRVAEQNKILRRPRNEHVPYLTPGMLLRHIFSLHNYTPGNPGNFEPLRDEDSEGPGEHGVPHHTKPEQADRVSETIDAYGMNMVASDEIGLDRGLPDTRMKECKDWHYPTDLPKASVVIVFHNEGRSVLLRTIHSVINR